MVVVLLAIRFAIEVALLAAFVLWGVRTGNGIVGWILGLAAAAAATMLWGTFVAPKARIRRPLAFRLAVEAAIVLTAVVALWSVDLGGLAVVLLIAETLTVPALIALGRPPGT
jgi:hypothetical protein